MKKVNLLQIVESFHQLYPSKSVLYYTEDGNVFLEKSPAINHALKSGQKWFTSDKRKEAEEAGAKAAEEAAIKAAEEYAVKSAENYAKDEADLKVETLVSPLKKLATVDLVTIHYHDALELAKDLDLELTDKKKATVMEALEAKIESLTKNNE
ncbi:MAG: hypothetical protein Q8O72_10625 [Bacteroidales bacterium]|nr:hypothetical protein [Bacteroidales bacterium]